jgi:hypothetical protein
MRRKTTSKWLSCCRPLSRGTKLLSDAAPLCQTPGRQGSGAGRATITRGEIVVPQFVIEREMPGVGKLGPADLKMASQTSCNVLRDLGPDIQWVHSYVTDNKIYCIYRAPNEEMVREHARRGGFPANKISQIRTLIDPTTAE